MVVQEQGVVVKHAFLYARVCTARQSGAGGGANTCWRVTRCGCVVTTYHNDPNLFMPNISLPIETNGPRNKFIHQTFLGIHYSFIHSNPTRLDRPYLIFTSPPLLCALASGAHVLTICKEGTSIIILLD
jgi:hypothetical protein